MSTTEPTADGTGPAREWPLGLTPIGDGRSQALVWAPHADRVTLQLLGHGGRGDEAARDPRSVPLAPAGGGYHGAIVEGCGAGTRYRFTLDGGPVLADPASRFQPEGVTGPSEVFDPGAHHWGDAGFRTRPLSSHVLYEMHVGTLTSGGTFDAAIGVLDDLVELGVTAVEPMPVAEFPGRRNWGYDGVFPYAAQSSYGGPAALQRFVDACHRRDLSVVLDVVYNHLGPKGNVLGAYGPYFTDRYRTPWGPAINFDGPGSDEVRRFFLENALGWFRHFHLDGLRLDALHGIVDQTASPFVGDLARATTDLGADLGRRLFLIAESADNDPRVVTPLAAGGLGMDAQWNDDFHHALHAAATGERLGYYADFGGAARVARAIDQGFVYQGEYSPFRGRRHGARSTGIEPQRFVVFAQNHDHVGNRPRGDRLASIVELPRVRAAAALVLLAPGVPLLFMGEEYGETAPFPYFVDHGDAELLRAVGKGRAEELATHGWDDEPFDPGDPATFAAAVLDRSLRLRNGHAELWSLYRRLLRLRRACPALSRSSRQDTTAHAEGDVVVMTRTAGPVVVRIAVNLGTEVAPARVTAPLPPVPSDLGSRSPDEAPVWSCLVDSSDPAIGGHGQRLPATVPAEALEPVALEPWAFCAYRLAPAPDRQDRT